MGNVFVMAGVPKIMNAMMEDVATRLTRGVPMRLAQVEFRGGEGDAAKPLGEIQKAFPGGGDRLLSRSRRRMASPPTWCCARATRRRSSEAYQAVCRMAQELTEQGKARGWA